MNNVWIRGITAVLLGVVIGGAVNMTIVIYGGSLVALPESVNPADSASLAENMHRFGPEHFVAPWLAHAMGSFVGGLVAGLVALRHRMRFALGIAAFTMLGGVINAFLLPAPAWFIGADLVLAYLPMGWLAGRIAVSLLGEAGPDPAGT